MSSILIAHQFQAVAQGISALLKQADYEDITTVFTVEDLFVELNKTNPEILIVEIGFLAAHFKAKPGWDAAIPIARMILLTKPGEIRNRALEIPYGIGGLVSATSRFEVMLVSIQQLGKGNRFIDPELQNEWNEYCLNGAIQLTPRQYQIVNMVANGKTSKRIAEQLNLSQKTVDNHRARIRERLGVSTSAEMINVCRKNGWIT